jgi:uncharacterized damage-inducible protein DinB
MPSKKPVKPPVAPARKPGPPVAAKPAPSAARPPSPTPSGGASPKAPLTAKPGAQAKPAPAKSLLAKSLLAKSAPPKSVPAKPSGGKPAVGANPATTGKPASGAKPVAGAKPGTAKPTGAKPATAAGDAGAPALSTVAQQRAITNMKAFFERTLSALDESDSAFAPAAGMFTTAQQVAHAAQTYDWFREGAFSAKGFRMDFPAMEAEVRKVTSLTAAKTWLDEAHQRLLRSLQTRPAADWHAPIAKDTIMSGAPRIAVVDGLVDHTAHHRGALAVYARLRGKTPPMPYM